MKKQLIFITSVLFLFISQTDAQILINENFDDGIPASWSQTTLSEDGGWLHGDAGELRSDYWEIEDPRDGTKFIASNDDACNCDKSEDYLIMPSVDLSGGSDFAYFEIEYIFRSGNWEGTTEELFLMASLDNGNSWETVFSFEEDGYDITWRRKLIDVSEYTGNSNVVFALLYDDGSGWTWGAAVNHVQLTHARSYDMSLQLMNDQYRFAEVGEKIGLSGILSNKGSETVTDVELQLITPDQTYNFMYQGTLDRLESVNITVPEDVVISAASSFDVRLQVVGVNGFSDEIPENNIIDLEMTGVINPPHKRMFVEQLVGTWCGDCPASYHFQKYLEDRAPELFSIVNVHSGLEDWINPMENYEYTEIYDFYKDKLPRISVDRISINDAPEPYNYDELLADLLFLRQQRISPFGIEIDAVTDGVNTELDIQVRITAHTNLVDEKFKVLLLVLEDGIHGGAEEYMQANGYSGYDDYPEIEPWNFMDNPVSGDNMTYDRVLTISFTNGANGIEGIIPSNFEYNDHFGFGASFSIPEDRDSDDFSFLAVILDGESGIALNAAENDGLTLVSNTENQLLKNRKVYVNHMRNEIIIEEGQDFPKTSFELYDMVGKHVLTADLDPNSGERIVIPYIDGLEGIFVANFRQNGLNKAVKLLLN